MSKRFTRRELAEIALRLSAPRLSKYAQHPPNTRQALALYRWNAQVSAAFIVPLHVCEVVTRNAIAEAIEKVYGTTWFTDPGFERSLPYFPRKNLVDTRRNHNLAGELVAELKAFFWVTMLTSRHDAALWNNHLQTRFPHLPTKSDDRSKPEAHARAARACTPVS